MILKIVRVKNDVSVAKSGATMSIILYLFSSANASSCAPMYPSMYRPVKYSTTF